MLRTKQRNSTPAIVLVIGVAAAATTCERADRVGVDEPNPPARAEPADPVDPADELDQAAADVEEGKDEAVAQARARLQEVDRELDRLAEQARQHGTEVRAELREERRELQTRIDRLEQASKETWERTRAETRRDIANALESLERQIREARNELEANPGRDAPDQGGAPASERTNRP